MALVTSLKSNPKLAGHSDIEFKRTLKSGDSNLSSSLGRVLSVDYA